MQLSYADDTAPKELNKNFGLVTGLTSGLIQNYSRSNNTILKQLVNNQYDFSIQENNTVELSDGESFTQIRIVGGMPLLTSQNKYGVISFTPDLSIPVDLNNRLIVDEAINELVNQIADAAWVDTDNDFQDKHYAMSQPHLSLKSINSKPEVFGIACSNESLILGAATIVAASTCTTATPLCLAALMAYAVAYDDWLACRARESGSIGGP